MTKSKPFAQLWLGCTLGILLAACTPQSDLALSEQSQPRPSLPSPWPPYWGVDEEDRAYLRNLMQGVSFFAGLRETGRFVPPKNDGSAEDEAYIEELEFCEDLSHDFLAQENITYLHPFATVSAETGLLDLASQSPLLDSLLPPGCRNLALNVGQEDVTGGLWSELFFGTEKLAIYLIDRNHDRIPDRLISYGEGAYRAKDAMQALGIAQSELSPPWVEDPQYSNWNIRLPPQSVPQEVIEGAAIIAEVDLATCRYLRDGFQAPASHWRSVKTGMSVDEMESLSQAISGSWFATMPPKTQYNFFINYRGVDLLASFSMWRAQKFNEYTTVSGVLEFFSLGNANSFEDPGRLHRPELCSAGWSSYLD